MDLSKLKNDRKLFLCRCYFLGGFACLPFLWCVNFVWFFSEAFRKPLYEEQKQIRKYVIVSGIGGLLWIIAITTWVVIFQTHRASWGPAADAFQEILASKRAQET